MESYGERAFEKYKKTAQLICLVGSLYSADSGSLNRNQAVCCGLLVRIAKYMLIVMKLSSDNENGDASLALTRIIEESAVNVRYLMCRNDEASFDRFVHSGLAPEKELFNSIQNNIETRGGKVLLIEQRMLESIKSKCVLSGVDVKAIDPNCKDIDFASKLRYLKKEGLVLQDRAVYLTYRMGSHAVHGTWMDLLTNHLEPKDGGFVCDLDHKKTNGTLFNPTCLLVIPAAMEYLAAYFDDAETEPVRQSLADLLVEINVDENSSPDWQLV